MWFAKWFGGRHDDDEGYEPARHAPPQARQPDQDVTRSPTTVARKSPQSLDGKIPDGKGGKKGFDPYNSGAFERRNAWERITRR